MMIFNDLRRTLLASAVSLACVGPAMANDLMLPAGSIRTDAASVGGADHVVIDSGAAWVADDTVIKWKDSSTALVIDNAGLIQSSEDEGRAINASGDGTGSRYLILNNASGGIIESQSDAFRINTDFSEGQVVINNAGTIHSTVDGQALDFDAVYGSGTAAASIAINNLSGGIIRADDADAIRPGEGATVNNTGTIYAGGVAGDSSDGIDFQAHAGTVVNLAGGLITGQRHGITSDTDIKVFNAAGATIIGRNGSGVGSDGSGTVANYGTITGAYDGSGTGDGDGVDIDHYGVVENWGLIQGIGAAGFDKSGDPNSSEGITITGGGTIYNHATGVITGIRNGVTAYNTFDITNEGYISGGDAGVFLMGESSLVNSGTIASAYNAVWYMSGSTGILVNSGTLTGGNYAVQFADGNDTLVIDKGSTISGGVDGGDGYDTLWLRGGTFDQAQNFEYLHVTGSATLSGDNAFANVLIEGTLQLGAGGTTGSLGSAAIIDNGILQVDRSDDVTLANSISGTGGVEQDGTGTTTLTGTNTYTGRTAVNSGTLVIGFNGMGSVAGDAVVASSATLRGTGSISGQLTVEDSGTLALGGSTDRGALKVGGNVDLQPGSIVRIDSTGGGLVSSGHMSIGDNVALDVSDATTMPLNTAFTAIAAAQGVNGKFASTTVLGASLAFLTPTIAYGNSEVTVSLHRNEVALASVATSRDERSTANAIDALSVETPLASAVLVKDAAAAQAAIAGLSGSQYASTRAVLITDSRELRTAIDRHLTGLDDVNVQGRSAEGHGVTAWTAVYGQDGSNSRGDAAKLDSNASGLIIGADLALDGGHVGGVAGHGESNTHLKSQDSSSHSTRNDLGVYADANLEGWRVRGAATYSRLNVDTTRHLDIGLTPDRLASRFDASVAQAFVEAGYRFDIGARQWLEPFANASRIRLHTDSASEGDALGALDIASRTTNVNEFNLGLYHSISLGESGRTRLHGSIAWQFASGDVNSESVQRFAGTSADFTVRGTPIARQAAAVEAGVDVALSARTSLGASYDGLFGGHAREQGGRVQLTVQF